MQIRIVTLITKRRPGEVGLIFTIAISIYLINTLRLSSRGAAANSPRCSYTVIIHVVPQKTTPRLFDFDSLSVARRTGMYCLRFRKTVKIKNTSSFLWQDRMVTSYFETTFCHLFS